ncbi:MAG: hypothetical protein CGW95_06560 [Phenylobacterium zucineum]|nr:MAG: hypothetical protein CGW95_06560 [Phenylobacterium zucineum]
MSHELTIRESGKVEFAFRATDGAPWHGLGQSMAEGASIEDWRVAAGMDWKVQRGVVRFNVDREGTQIAMPEQHVLFRNDNKMPLGVVSDKYQVVQPAEVLEFFREIAHVGGLEMSAAGTIYGGKRFWATAKIGDAAPLGLQDKVGGYLLISTSADGSLSTEVRRTTVRVVCRNTLQMARGEKAAMKITHRSKFDASAVHEFMGLNEVAWSQFRKDMVKLANTVVTNDTAERVLKELFKSPETSGYKKVLDLFNGAGIGSNLDGSQGTAWGLINSVTEYADRHVRATSEANRFVSSQWGPGNALKAQALNLLLPA